MKNKKVSLICCILAPLLILALGIISEINNIPNTIYIRKGEKLTFSPLIRMSEDKVLSKIENENTKITDKKLNVNLLGVLKVKSINVRAVSNDIEIYPGGQPVGVKLNTKGVLVVALSDIGEGSDKIASPAATAGILIGDSILEINKVPIQSSQDALDEINKSKGKEIELLIERSGEKFVQKLVPVKSSQDKNYKIGLWIRDSTAGVGTLTFYDANSNIFAALGHPITDIDTGSILQVSKGNITNSSIISIKKGEKGSPGELRGIFINELNPIGSISKNTQCGIFGKANKSLANENYNKPMKIALKNEIKVGPAKILTTIEGESPQEYDIVIEKLLAQETVGPKSMIIKIVDPKLLEKTGGIVQGMSGSPIIQDNKIVGAITHVLVNRPDTGYGIYIEWMLKDAGLIS